MKLRLKGLVTMMAAICAATTPAMHIVGWSTARGGFSSLASAPGYAAARTAIQTQFPGATFGAVDTLSTDSLANADVVWLASAAGETTAISPLTTDEQAVLLAFASGGGRVMIFGDNSTFSPGAPAANNSLMNVFGVSMTGTLNNSQAHTFGTPTAYPAVGIAGTCAPLVSGFPGWFSTIPNNFQVVTRLNANNQPSCVTTPPGGLSPGSGRVWLLSDTGAITGGGAQNTNWNVLFVNMLQEHSRLSGTITLSDWVGDTAALTAKITVWDGTTPVFTAENVPLSSSGGYQVTVPLYGNYSVSAEVSHWLRRRTSVLVQDWSDADFVLPNGDADGSGEVDAADIDAVIADFGGNNPNADLDGSGETDAADIDIAIANFGTVDE